MVEISVIMPVYNCEEYLNQTIECILNQTFTDLEFICVDDGSTDNSLQILNDYAEKDSRMQVYHQENQGGGNARNFGLTKATGKYLYFMDADDLLDLNALNETHDIIENKKVDFVIFKATSYNDVEDKYFETEYFSMSRIYRIVGDDVFHYSAIGNLIFEMSATPWGKLYNMEFIRNSGAQFAEGIIFHDNKFFWEMIFNSKKIYFYNKSLYTRRIHSNSIQGSKDERFLNIFIAMKGIFDIIVKYDKLDDYKNHFYNWKVNLLLIRYHQIQDQFKNQFIDEFKNDLNEMITYEGYDKLIRILNSKNRTIFENVMQADTYKEFNLLMERYELKNEMKELKKSNKELKSLNDELINSNSWKMTGPLRRLRHFR